MGLMASGQLLVQQSRMTSIWDERINDPQVTTFKAALGQPPQIEGTFGIYMWRLQQLKEVQKNIKNNRSLSLYFLIIHINTFTVC